jgi:hypothetical protein
MQHLRAQAANAAAATSRGKGISKRRDCRDWEQEQERQGIAPLAFESVKPAFPSCHDGGEPNRTQPVGLIAKIGRGFKGNAGTLVSPRHGRRGKKNTGRTFAFQVEPESRPEDCDVADEF